MFRRRFSRENFSNGDNRRRPPDPQNCRAEETVVPPAKPSWLKKQRKLRGVDVTVAAFAITGAINWLSRWYRPGGSLSAEEIAWQIADIALNGVLR